MTQLSFNPPPVTCCFECRYDGYDTHGGLRWSVCDHPSGKGNHAENKNGITKTCPMWVEQNKEVV